MTPEEKAIELVGKMQVIHYVKLGGKNGKSKGLPVSMYKSQTKQCALICVEEIIENEVEENLHPDDDILEYWQEVKKEINKL
jgi:hypothetical protein